ncbi:Uncharacterised protein [Mycobacteroides abscessus subsp. abscessus]|nr:Uncharacterised protein [Mycobacteroides abscessus subsp. abscessus]
MPLLVGALSLPIEVGMVLMISPLRSMLRILLVSSTRLITASPMVKWDATLSWPKTPSPRFTP